jgi:phosphate transport system permease protein
MTDRAIESPPPASLPPRSLRFASRPARNAGDRAFGAIGATSAAVLALVLVVVAASVTHLAWPSLQRFGGSFLGARDWDPVHETFGALSFLFGTIVTSAVAMLLAVPIGLGVALFLTDLGPRRLRRPVAMLVELLAAIPSVVYGLWAALVLAIMVLPTIASIAREVLSAVPTELREGGLALGATRWDVVRRIVVPHARSGLGGAVLLGFGRAVGETMAVATVVGSKAQITSSLFAPGYTMSSVIANEFPTAAGDLHRAALAEVGMVLFAVTLIVNVGARVLVKRAGAAKATKEARA